MSHCKSCGRLVRRKCVGGRVRVDPQKRTKRRSKKKWGGLRDGWMDKSSVETEDVVA